ncbi:hypothetical protein ACFX2I_022128 [Malus domestica]|uniref:F-box protein CPR1-like n=1 Tax=Malus domestica TaxID=3750 RepID=UPI0039753287
MIQNLPCNGFAMHNSEIVFLNGALSWLMRGKLDNNRCIILTLDLASEKYQEFDTPVHENGTCVIDLEVLGGSLCISVDDWWCRHYVWIMKEYGVVESWTLLYSIGQDNMPWLFEYCRPLGFSKNGAIVLLKKDDDALVWFDLEGKKCQPSRIGGLPLTFEASICVGSPSLLDGDPVIVGRPQ